MRTAAPIVLALSWLLIYPACSTPATALQAPTPEAITFIQLEGLVGFAHWECSEEHPTAWVRVYYQGLNLANFQNGELWVTPGFRETIGHELQHIVQIQREGSCAEWKAKLADPAYREAMEREATCVGMELGRGIPCKVP